MRRGVVNVVLLVIGASVSSACGSEKVSPDMTFFVTSVPAGR